MGDALVNGLHILFKEPQGISLLGGPTFDKLSVAKIEGIPCTSATFSEDGSRLLLVLKDGVKIIDTGNGTEFFLTLEDIVSAVFSPRATYIQTFQRPSTQGKNVCLWNAKTGVSVWAQFQKNMSKSNWPAIHFSTDETIACRLVSNEVHVYNGLDFSKGVISKLRLPGIWAVHVAPQPPAYIATYNPETKGCPAVVRIFDMERLDGDQPVARRSFFKSSTVQMMWNSLSTGLLVLAHSDVDKTNQSYYGETRLHFLTTDGSHEGAVPLSKDGPIHDAQWSPTGRQFLVIYGFMPAKTTMFDTKCRPIFEFGTGPYNTIRWNPYGSFICLAGFGNLPGDMAFWDSTSMKLLGTSKAPCSVTSEWSPDGRLLMTATTMPRMQIDNRIKVFKYNGTLLFERSFEKLYQAIWQPVPLGVYADRPASPTPLKAGSDKTSGGTVPAKPAAYRPPHSSGSSSLKTILFGGGGDSTSEQKKAASKNKKRREKQKEKKEVEGSTIQVEEPAVTMSHKLEETSPAITNDQSDDNAKRVRALNKKLRQIEEIKAKVIQAGGRCNLTTDQEEKLGQEVTLREEIQRLQLK